MILFRVPKYQLYLLQLENYELGRYFKLLFRGGYFGRRNLRGDLKWTNKVRLILLLSFILYFVSLYLVFSSSIIFGILLLLLGCCFFPLLYSISVIAITPFEFFVKSIMISNAKKRVDAKKIIVIAGSYGKTTMKNIVESVLSQKYKVMATPESINTPVGIASWINKKVSKTTEILVVEAGEHYLGDVRKICQFVPPEIVIITGINEAHFERLKNISNVIKVVFEAAEAAKNNSRIFLNKDDKLVTENYKKYIRKDEIVNFYSKEEIKRDFDAERLRWNIKLPDLGEMSVNMLGEYAIADVSAAVKISKELGLSNAEIFRGVNNIVPVEHRLQPMPSQSDILVIDDSYNGNPEGVKEAIEVLSRFKGKRKIYLTPGLVESGSKNQKVHIEIGKLLSKIADLVILVRNSSTLFIEQGLIDSGYDRHNIIWFSNAVEAHRGLKDIVEPSDVVLLQNDWGDQYL